MILPHRWDVYKASLRLECLSEGVSSTKVPAIKRPKPWTQTEKKIKLNNDDTQSNLHSMGIISIRPKA